MSTLRLLMLPAADGDCLLLSWGDDSHLHHMVVDGGRTSAYPHLKKRLSSIADKGESLELYVLTHIDADHIEGALAYLRDSNRPLVPKQVWYNGRTEMTSTGIRSMKQGDAYSVALAKLEWPLNTSFCDGVAKIESAPGVIDIAGLKITMLSPDELHLAALGSKWSQWHQQQGVRARGLVKKPKRPLPPNPLIVEDLIAPGPIDTELPNGSSIAFIAEWGERRILFGGDAHPDLLAASLEPLAAGEGGRYRVDVLKASHHGSAKNTCRKLIEMLDCRRLAISTNGNIHCHPDPQAIALFLHFGPEGRKHLYFNYVTEQTRPWAKPEVADRYGYSAHFPPDEEGMIAIDVLADD
ncbi:MULTISPECIES: ComEC/Rec2 family competence protein [Sphingobium]|jgi:hypothetical protein|uniref:MBL fold metallo-hydrolase n=1 Tax=Sphingobium limneticum TaxID=1007511 RepID=A0A5J5I0A3_9SPHN|nr:MULTISPECIES: hypothetical protein [Sphingobium]KAA9014941.1 hypothetical protein F4U96_14865 [Sphingobium limneticum]KAA9017364.1 hypothetical protein F4U94_09130 [Sphingobium limneticum]KAA9027866.1 hypothetical protein F4U95_14990 [Sphingobium limneticum]